ncbi:MAG: response regulator, partial [Thermodesulfobacteriota bacterium]
EDYVQKGSDLTKQLLGFARGGKYEVKPADLNKLIMKSLEMFARTRKEIIIHTEYQENLWLAEVDKGQLEQALLNLFINAWQAMPSGGDLYIQTENVILDENYIKPFEVKTGKYIKISITDNGMGMDEETQQRIFDPFFTTKKMGRGTGLGLASVYGIVKNHDGLINVYSKVDKGTTFTIYLPASDQEVAEETELSAKLIPGAGTVLLVDDEQMMIDVAEKMIQHLGFTVLVALSGEEAINIYKENKDKIDVVLLDMLMPGMDGGEVYDRLKEINPGVRALLSSGYSLNGEAQNILSRGCDGFVQKPYGIEELSHKLHEVMNER